MNHALHVRAAAFWSAEFGSLAAWRAGTRRSGVEAPKAEVLPVRVRARASALTRMLVEVLSQVALEGECELASLPLVIGSAFGEMDTTVQLLQMMNTSDGALSPARFQASVHSTAAGTLSIAASARGFSTCLAAGPATSAAVLAEAYGWLSQAGGQVVVAVADERLPAFFSQHDQPYGPLSAALLLSAKPVGRVLATLGPPLHSAALAHLPSAHDAAEDYAHNPITPFLAVLRAVLGKRTQSVALPGISGSWQHEVVPVENAA